MRNYVLHVICLFVIYYISNFVWMAEFWFCLYKFLVIASLLLSKGIHVKNQFDSALYLYDVIDRSNLSNHSQLC